jgi:hypothetical protein
MPLAVMRYGLPHANHDRATRAQSLTPHLAQLLLGRGGGDVDLVAQHKEGHRAEVVIGEQGVQLALRLGEAFPVGGVHQVHDGVDLPPK